MRKLLLVIALLVSDGAARAEAGAPPAQPEKTTQVRKQKAAQGTPGRWKAAPKEAGKAPARSARAPEPKPTPEQPPKPCEPVKPCPIE